MRVSRPRGLSAIVIPLLFLAAALAALAIASGRQSSVPEARRSAPLTPAGPAVDGLRRAAGHANLVICVIDAARADHVGCYGYPRDTTPSIDSLARQSFVFRRHFAQYASTKPSTASLFTSQHADTHLAYGNNPIAEGTFTLADGLGDAGFRTVMFSSNPNAAPGTGLGLDFQEVFDQRDVEPLVEKWDKLTLPQPLLSLFKSWLGRHRQERFFAYVHLDPPHQPYLQPAAMTRLFAGERPPSFVKGRFEFPVGDRQTLAEVAHPPLSEWVNLYDANLRFADWAVGELARLLSEADVLDDTVLIITSDHGEAFGEHGYIWHERGVYDELVHVPLIVRLPAGAGRGDIAGLTQTMDILPTVFDLFGIPYPRQGIQGVSLLPLMAGTAGRVNEHIVSRSDGSPPVYLVRSEKWSLMLWGNGRWRALYDLAADPGQKHNVLAQRRDVSDRMVGQFRRFMRTQRRPLLEFLDPKAAPTPVPEAGRKLTGEDKKRLRALGYLR
ncbi:MAG: sulfatase [Armatimonadota bacterium]